ncbi:MAG: SMC-Scp complex subunit ScpB [Thomasclavelia sp.]|nr:SMC-Scp complex subunit ScpB [Thomasclavelia sp.]
MDKNKMLSIIEGILYLVGSDGIDIKELSGVLELSKKETTELMDEFIQTYNDRSLNGLNIVDFGHRYKLATNPEYFIYYQKLVEQTKANLSNAALETLAIIAYNQPITRTAVEDIRGVGCDAMIRKLVAKALIKEVGREETPGTPILYGVTDEFMDAFGLTSLDELPELEDIVETGDNEDIFDTRYQDKETSNDESNKEDSVN